MDGVTVTSSPLPPGDTGVRKTLGNMTVLAERGSRDPQFRNAVINAVRYAGAHGHDKPAEVDAWFRFVRDRIYFVDDPVGVEWLQDPRVTLFQNRAGDCDDRAVLLAAGLRAIGVPAAFKVVAADPRRRDTFSHVYVVARLEGRDVPLDPTYPDNTLGSEPPMIFRTWMVPA
jgi:transglutaminase-like putative cysteine protease